MGGPETTTAQAIRGSRPPGPSSQSVTDRRPWWIWAGPFALALAVLVVRSRFLFTASF